MEREDEIKIQGRISDRRVMCCTLDKGTGNLVDPRGHKATRAVSRRMNEKAPRGSHM
jgi:hypothetical protein